MGRVSANLAVLALASFVCAQSPSPAFSYSQVVGAQRKAVKTNVADPVFEIPYAPGVLEALARQNAHKQYTTKGNLNNNKKKGVVKKLVSKKKVEQKSNRYRQFVMKNKGALVQPGNVFVNPTHLQTFVRGGQPILITSYQQPQPTDPNQLPWTYPSPSPQPGYPSQPQPAYPQPQPGYPSQQPQPQPEYPPQQPQPAYPSQPQPQPGYPPQQPQPGYPPQQPEYPAQQPQPGYPPQQPQPQPLPGYPPQQPQPGYPPQQPQPQPGYPSQQPQPQPGYPSQQPQPQPGYPPQQPQPQPLPGYPSQQPQPQPGYPPQQPQPQPGYPPQQPQPQPGYPPQQPQPIYPPQQPGYPQQPEPVQPQPLPPNEYPQPVAPEPQQPSQPEEPLLPQPGYPGTNEPEEEGEGELEVSEPPEQGSNNENQEGEDGSDQSANGCKAPRGQFASPTACNKFLNCWDGVAVEQECGGTLLFNEEASYCDFPQNVECGNRSLERPDPMQPDGGCPSPFGTFRDSTNCGAFIVCVDSKPNTFVCPGGLAYNDELGVCDYQYRVDCKGIPLLPPPPPEESVNEQEENTIEEQENQGEVDGAQPTEQPGQEAPAAVGGSGGLPSAGYPSAPGLPRFPLSCREGTITRVAADCRAVAACVRGQTRLLTCPMGYSYDLRTNTCLPYGHARCFF